MSENITSVHYGTGIRKTHSEEIQLYGDGNFERFRELGYCTLVYFDKPIKFYYIGYLEKKRNHTRGVGDTQTTGDQIVKKN